MKQSLQIQGKEQQALVIKEKFEKAWNQADVRLTASRFMDEAHTTLATARFGGFGVSK